MTRPYTPAKPAAREPSTGEAVGLGVGVLLLFWVIQSPKRAIVIADGLSAFLDKNETAVIVLTILSLTTLIWVASAFSLLFRKGGTQPNTRTTHGPHSLSTRLKVTVFSALNGGIAATILSRTTLAPSGLWLLPIQLTLNGWSVIFCALGTTAFAGFGVLLGRKLPIGISLFVRQTLPITPVIRDGIILGAVNEVESREDARTKRKAGLFPEWITIGLKGLTGNLFIAGAIGSGKSQVLLQFLKQLLSNFQNHPSLLAIDPKRTFVRELRKIIEAQGLSDYLVWISLQGDVRMNPIWCEGMLKNSGFTTIANSLKLASINFIGSSGDSRFWEQSSFNLLKNSLIYCAAKHKYFTFKELYGALVQARDVGLAASLVDCLTETTFDDEERGNIEGAIQYFTNEFSQMDEKIRTSILATATGFLNDFLEYRVTQILSPRKEEINFPSFRDAIRDGKLICLNIENDALAKSIGTLIKLLYQEAVLDRVTDENLAQARYALLVMDEYQDVATSGGGAGIGDDRFLSKARESKSITIAATQSVSSLENTIKSEAATRELLQGFRNRIFGNSTDPKTIRAFQEPRGMEEIERSSHNFSETSPDARKDLLFGGYDSSKSNVSQGVSTHLAREYPVTAKEFSRLRTFESFAQIFDGLDTRFEKLYLKPYFLPNIRTSHRKILDELRAQAKVQEVKRPRFWKYGLSSALLSLPAISSADVLYPNVCSALKAPQFRSCLGFAVGGCMCGFPPHPCAQLSYYLPQTFIEVWPNAKQSLFSKLPGASAQLAPTPGTVPPFGVDDEMGGFSFHAHAVAVPMASEVLSSLPCGGTRSSKPCFDLMSEDLGSQWKTGLADTLQPKFMAWSLAKKACLLKGAVSGFSGQTDVSLGGDSGGCSYSLAALTKYPPSGREACNGWGLFYPRSGIYEGASRAAAALMVASRLKSLGTEVAGTIPGDMDEQWQMFYPQSSSCFKEGANSGLLEILQGVREEQRAFGKPNGYLFMVWKRVSCCRELAEVATTQAAIQALSVACQALPSGGI